MNVPFLDLKAQLPFIRSEIEERFSRIIDNTAFVCGREVREFEEAFAEKHDVKYCLGLSSGTDGNHLAFLSCHISPGDEVLLPVNTFIATAEGISHAGAVPVFVDVDENSFNIDTDQIEAKITSNTKAINPVHLFGQPADMEKVLDIARNYGLMVLEDAAQAHIAQFQDRKVGGIGEIASWSFYPGKNLGAWGEAGALTTNNADFYECAKKMRDHGCAKKYCHDLIGHNYRMSEFQAAVLNVKLKYIDEWTERRRNNAALYNEMLKDVEEVITPKEKDDVRHSYHLYVIRAKERDRLQTYLAEKGISSGLHYPVPLHLTPAYSSLGYKEGDFSVAEKLAEEILSLPMYPELRREQIEYVCKTIKDFSAMI